MLAFPALVFALAIVTFMGQNLRNAFPQMGWGQRMNFRGDEPLPLAGMNPIRIYTPLGGEGALPVLLYFHGGGFVIADVAAGEEFGAVLLAPWEGRAAPTPPPPRQKGDVKP